MIASRTFVTGEHPVEGKLWAAVDASTRFTVPKVADARFAALLTPYRTLSEARAGLEAAGAVVEGGQ